MGICLALPPTDLVQPNVSITARVSESVREKDLQAFGKTISMVVWGLRGKGPRQGAQLGVIAVVLTCHQAVASQVPIHAGSRR